jgi:hypothetical protein
VNDHSPTITETTEYAVLMPNGETTGFDVPHNPERTGPGLSAALVGFTAGSPRHEVVVAADGTLTPNSVATLNGHLAHMHRVALERIGAPSHEEVEVPVVAQRRYLVIADAWKASDTKGAGA